MDADTAALPPRPRACPPHAAAPHPSQLSLWSPQTPLLESLLLTSAHRLPTWLESPWPLYPCLRKLWWHTWAFVYLATWLPLLPVWAGSVSYLILVSLAAIIMDVTEIVFPKCSWSEWLNTWIIKSSAFLSFSILTYQICYVLLR